MENKSIREIISVIFKAVTLAMGVAVVVLSCLGSLDVQTAVTLLGIGLACAGAAMLVLAGVAVFLCGSNRENFNGSRVKNPDAYLLDIERMNGTDLHTLELCEGDVLQIEFKTEKGDLYMEIKAPDGTSLYRGNGKETTEFTVNIRESGVYTIVVEARHAKGTIHVQLAGGINE